MRGNINENAGAIIEILHKNPDMSVEEAAAAARSLLRRERGGCVLSGQTRRNGKSRRVAPIVEITAGESDETGGFAAIAIDFTEPDSHIKMQEIAQFAMTEKGRDLMSRAEPLVRELDRLRDESGETVANNNDVSRRQGFNIKAQRKKALENTLARLRAHFEWCLENGVSEIAMESEETNAQDFFDRATQTGFDFGEGE
ncbi:MAG: hypothetical protein ABT24_10795 [Thiomonas sp. SCN 64-16]|nr:MAG: hypothetical protein ABT24_10795 [Thiomonas sp. SCN 64-16]